MITKMFRNALLAISATLALSSPSFAKDDGSVGLAVRAKNAASIGTFAQAKAKDIFSATGQSKRIILDDRDQSTWIPLATLPQAMDASQENYSWFRDAASRVWQLASEPLTPEMMGAVGDYNYTTKTGTVNTAPLQAEINFARVTGRSIQPKGGRKYLTGALYLNYDAVYNPVGENLRPGRISIIGSAAGLATGSLEDQGGAFIHINNEARPLLTLSGSFTIGGNDNTGGKLAIERFNLVGGNATPDVLYIKGSNGQISLTDMTIKSVNKTGNGATVSTTWEKLINNVLLRGAGTGIGPNEANYDATNLATGIGWNEIDDGSGGQVNMSVYTNMDTYKWGYGVKIGRSSPSMTGTYGPLIFIGGQTALSDQVGFTLGAGVYTFTAIGYQIEQSRLNALLIDSSGGSGTDLIRNVKWINGYFTSNGKIEDGTANSFAVNVVDGTGVHLDHPIFQNTRSGITFDRSKAFDLNIDTPEFRTVSTWGAASGTCISASGTLANSMRQSLEALVVGNACATVIDSSAAAAFAQRYRLSVSQNSTQPTLNMGSRGGSESAQQLNFNNPAATTVTNILGGTQFQTLLCTFSTINTTLQTGGSLILNGNYTPSTVRGTLFLFYDGTRWLEISRFLG